MPPAPEEVTPALTTNRKKAIFFCNIYAIALFIYTTLLKILINEKKVNPMDICVIRTLVMLLGTLTIALCMRQSFHVEKKDRLTLICRSTIGTIGFTTLIFGVAIVPLVV